MLLLYEPADLERRRGFAGALGLLAAPGNQLTSPLELPREQLTTDASAAPAWVHPSRDVQSTGCPSPARW